MHRGISETLQNWFNTFSIVYISTFGFIIALICVYALPDKSVQPETGVYYILTGLMVFSVFILTNLRKKRIVPQSKIEKKGFKGSIMNWIISFVIFSLSSYSVVYPLIFIYALPSNIPNPLVGFRFFISGSVAILILIVVEFIITRGEVKKALVYLKENRIPFEIKKMLSDRILNAIIIIYSIGVVFWGFAYSLICIYSLPDMSVNTKASGLSFFISLIVLVSLIAAIAIKKDIYDGYGKSKVPPKLPNS